MERLFSVYLAPPATVRAALAAEGLEAAALLERRDRTVVGLRGASARRGESRLVAAFGAAAVAAGDLGLVRRVAGSLIEARATLALAESCTGGLVAKLLTDIPGSSGFLLGGVVAYANAAKEALLGVPAALIERHGAVSRQVVEAMAAGAASAFEATLAAAVSGVAGPDGGTAEKPVGTVWIGTFGPEGLVARRFLFAGDRERVRDLAAWTALLMVQERVTGIPASRQDA